MRTAPGCSELESQSVIHKDYMDPAFMSDRGGGNYGGFPQR